MLLAVNGPLDLESTLDGGQAFRWELDPADGWWVGPMGDNLVRLRLVDRDGNPFLEAESSPAPMNSVGPTLRRYLALDTDLGPVRQALSQDSILARAISTAPALRLLRQDPWECLTGFILSAQCHILRIKRNVEALARAAGQPITAWGRTAYSFPGPEAVAMLGEARLRELGLGFRAPNLVAAARALAEGRVDLEALRSRPYLAARDVLLTLSGVGPKIADCVLAFSLDQMEAFPVDRWVMRSLQHLYLGEAHIATEKAATWARDRFGPHAAYVQQLLFYVERAHALETRPIPGSRAMRANRDAERAIV